MVQSSLSLFFFQVSDMTHIASLANLGNTCYLNTILQCLGHCPAFARFFLGTNHQDKETLLLAQVQDIIVSFWSSHTDNIVISPRGVLHALRECMPGLNIHEENDVHEFLMMFIDKLNHQASIMNETVSALASPSRKLDGLVKSLNTDWEKHFKKENSPFVPMFYGQTVTQIICDSCDKIFHNFEPFSVLLLPFSSTDLGECVKSYFQQERIQFWTCDRCHKTVDSIKSIKPCRLPVILTLCLKRFDNNMKKDSREVSVPSDIELSGYNLFPDGGGSSYELRAIACHNGMYGGGHYHALCKRPDGTWYKFDDCHASQVQAPTTTRSGYTFFYHKS